jgi:hypothetical protein
MALYHFASAVCFEHLCANGMGEWSRKARAELARRIGGPREPERERHLGLRAGSKDAHVRRLAAARAGRT